MSDELKPCPFCGQPPRVCNWLNPIKVHCQGCGTSPALPEDWNHRPIEDALRANVEKLERVREAARIACAYGTDEGWFCPWCWGKAEHEEGCEMAAVDAALAACEEER